ncbi:hypothetical protein FML86_21365, partial [Mycobacterium tuberculosis]
PRIEVGLPTVCSETCVGRLRYLGLVLYDVDQVLGAAGSSALLVGRDRVAGADAAYVCRGRVCDLPVTSAAELATALGVPG